MKSQRGSQMQLLNTLLPGGANLRRVVRAQLQGFSPLAARVLAGEKLNAIKGV